MLRERSDSLPCATASLRRPRPTFACRPSPVSSHLAGICRASPVCGWTPGRLRRCHGLSRRCSSRQCSLMAPASTRLGYTRCGWAATSPGTRWASPTWCLPILRWLLGLNSSTMVLLYPPDIHCVFTGTTYPPMLCCLFEPASSPTGSPPWQNFTQVPVAT